MNSEQLKALQMEQGQKTRPQRSMRIIFLIVLLATGAALFFAWPRESDKRRLAKSATGAKSVSDTAGDSSSSASSVQSSTNAPVVASDDKVMLTVSGYIINRERIEVSPRFMGLVTWIGVKKGDAVTNGQVV